MIQLLGQSATSVAPGADGSAPSTGGRAFATPANADRALLHVDLRRSLGMHWRLALAVVIAFATLATLYFLNEAMVLQQQPAYESVSTVDVKPTPTTIVPKQGGSQQLPFDSNTFETYIQQQMTNVRRDDVLIAALHKLAGFQGVGESDQAAEQRLGSELEVTQEGSAYRFSIGAHAESPEMAAQIANAVTAAFIESPTRDVPAAGAQRLQMWKEEQNKIQSALAADRTELKTLKGRLQQPEGAAASDPGDAQRWSDLTAQMARLQARNAKVDEQLHDPKLQDSAPTVTYQVTPAVPPPGRPQSVVLRNALMIAVAGLFLGVLAAVCAHRLDPRVYIGADVERVLGFAPLAQLPDFNEVSDGAAEEYMLRLASAIEQGRKQANLKNCIFTGTGSETGVSTLVNRVTEMLAAMGRTTLLVDATGAQAPALLEEMAGARKSGEDSLLVTDTAPLAVSAETEYLARFADCAIVVIASGVTTRAELREAARTFERLKVSAVGFVLNRVGLKKADAAFRTSVEGVERHLRIYGKSAAIRNERRSSFAPDRHAGLEASFTVPSVEAERIPSPLAEAVARLSLSVAASGAAAGPTTGAGSGVASATGAAEVERPVLAGTVALTAAASPLAAAQEEPYELVVATASQAQPEAAEEPGPGKAATKPEPDVPWWLVESMRSREMVHLPAAAAQPQKLWTAQRPLTDARIEAAAQSLNLDPKIFRQAFEQWRDCLPSLKETLRASPLAHLEEFPKSDLEEANGNLNSRLSAVRNLLAEMGRKVGQSGDGTGEHHHGGGASPKMVTGLAEFISPTALVAELEEREGALRQSLMRQD